MKKCMVLFLLCFTTLSFPNTDWRVAGLTAVGVYSCSRTFEVMTRDRTSNEARDILSGLSCAIIGALLIINARKIVEAVG